MSSLSTFECFGLVMHGYDWTRVKFEMDQCQSSHELCRIVTVNPEILVEAKQRPAYWSALREARLRLVDSFGLQAIGWLFGAHPARLPGVELAEKMLSLAEERHWRVLFVGGRNGVADRAAWVMRSKHPRLSIEIEEGGEVDMDGRGDEATSRLIQKIATQQPHLIFFAWNHPKPDLWISHNATELSGVLATVGVGGTFDYWAGTICRAPRLFRSLGLEWLWRVTIEPRRWRRILRAVFIFPVTAIWDKIF